MDRATHPRVLTDGTPVKARQEAVVVVAVNVHDVGVSIVLDTSDGVVLGQQLMPVKPASVVGVHYPGCMRGTNTSLFSHTSSQYRNILLGNF